MSSRSPSRSPREASPKGDVVKAEKAASPARKSRSPSRSPARSKSPKRSPKRSRSRSASRRGRSRSPSRSRSRSRGGRRERSRSPYRGRRSRSRTPEDTDVMHLGDSDVAFVLGRGGMTKQKLARVSGAQLEMDGNGRLEIRGNSESRKRARTYVELVLAQRVGPVYIDFEQKSDDLSIVDVPTDCVGYVTGRNGVVLRALEEEWGTLMFFAKGKSKKDKERNSDTERLAIYGTLRRRGAELKVMSAVEHKSPGFFLDSKGRPRGDILDRYDDGKFGITTLEIAEHEIGYALGKQGTTRKKLARAAGCILEYVGCTAFIAGTRDDRDRGRDYLEWLLEQQKGAVHVDTERRDDVTVLDVPSSVVGYLTGYKGASLREVEDKTDTFIFSNGDRRDSISNTDPDRIEKLLRERTTWDCVRGVTDDHFSALLAVLSIMHEALVTTRSLLSTSSTSAAAAAA